MGTVKFLLGQEMRAQLAQAGLVGRMATIVLGTARQGSPAQAKVRDQHGQTHYVMLEPDEDGASFQAGLVPVPEECSTLSPSSAAISGAA